MYIFLLLWLLCVEAVKLGVLYCLGSKVGKVKLAKNRGEDF